MELKEYFSSILKKNKSDSLMLHSSFLCKNKDTFNNSIDEIKEAIEDLSRQEYTFILPSYTFSFCKKNFYSTTSSKSETGILSDLVHSDLCGSVRSNHPIYSHVFIGPRSYAMSKLFGVTTFGEESIFEYLEKINATYALLNCGWEYATIFHRYEEIKTVNYRNYKIFKGEIKHYEEKLKEIEVKMFVRDLELNPINDMNRSLDALKKKKSYSQFTNEKFKLLSASVLDIKSTCLSLLKENNYALLENEKDIRKKIVKNKIKHNGNQFKVYILGFSNLDIFRKELNSNLDEFIENRSFKVLSNPYGQVFETLLDSKSDLYTEKPELIIATAFSQDFDLEKELDQLNNIFNRYIDEVINAASKIKSKVIFHRLVVPELTRFANTEKRIYQIIDLYNNTLMNKVINKENIQVIDPSGIAANNLFEIFDERTHYLGKIVNTSHFRKALIEYWISYITDLTGNSIRMIITDLDNTIWGGILGEEGISNIKVNGDFPGNCFQKFQKGPNEAVFAIEPSQEKLLKVFGYEGCMWGSYFTNFVTI